MAYAYTGPCEFPRILGQLRSQTHPLGRAETPVYLQLDGVTFGRGIARHFGAVRTRT
jgi:hypothetical protein